MYRVVIADDEVLIRMYIREILENNGYEVVGEAEDGLDAIAVCRQKKPDFVIMDINMPVMTGLEATKVINEDKLAGFVIILTAYRDKEIADQAVNTDVMGYIVIKMSTLNSTFFHVFIVLPFCTIRSLFYCIFSLLGSAIVRLPLLPTSHAPYFRSYASCFTSSSNSSPAE